MPASPFDLLNAINQQLTQVLPDVANTARQDINAQAKAALGNLVEKLELVTREEFEIQQQVLLRTREKLELMEQRITELEKLLQQQKTSISDKK